MTDIRYPYQGGVTSTDDEGLVIDPITGQLTLVLDGTSLSKTSSGLKWNDASTQFIDVSSSTTAFRVTQRGTGAALLIEDSANPDASPFFIDADGRVGIGTTNPTDILAIGSSGNKLFFRPNSDTVISNGTGLRTSATGFDLNIDSYSNIVFHTDTDQNQGGGPTTEKMIITATGNVGIGTTNPNNILHVIGTSNTSAALKIESSTSDTMLSLQNTATGGREWWLGSGSDSAGAGPNFYIYDRTSGGLRMTINSSGNVGIGTSNPQGKLEITTNSTTPAVLITQQGSGHCLVVEDSTNPDSTPFVIDTDGKVGIGTSTPGSALHLAQANGVAESGTCLFAEKDTTPGNPTDGTQVKMYMKADKIIFQYNDGGTVRYKYLDLTGTTDTWTATTTAP